MLNKNIQKIILLLILTLLFIGIISATNTDNQKNTTKDKIEKSIQYTQPIKENKEIIKSNTTTDIKSSTSKKTTKITINKIKTVEFSDKTSITGTYKTNTGKPLKNTVITLNINGKKYTAKTDNTGTYKYNYKTEKVGTNNITATYKGNKKYKQAIKKTTFKVTKKGTRIKLNTINTVAYSDKAIIKGKFTNNKAKALKSATIIMKINGKTYTAKTDDKGEFEYKYTANRVGTNNITAYFRGNNYYRYNSTKTTFKVNKKTLLIRLTNWNSYGSLIDKNEYSIKYAPIELTINSKKYQIKTSKYGDFDYTNKLDIGLNHITASYAGNSKYKATTSKTTNYMKPQDTEISISREDVYTDNAMQTIYGNLTDDLKNPLKNTKLTVNINGKTSTITTDNNGKFTYNYKNNDYNKIIITYAGNKRYTGSSITTNKYLLDTKIYAEIEGYQVGDMITIKGYVQDIIRGYKLYNMPIQININGKTYYTQTNNWSSYENPNFEYSFKADKAGLYNITISFINNTKYTNSVKKITHYIRGKETTLIINDNVKTSDKKFIKIQGKIYDSMGEMLKNVPIKIDLDGKTYTVRTNNEGTYTKYIKNNNILEHALYVTFEGNSKYNPSEEQQIFTAHNKEGEIEIATPLTPGEYDIYNDEAEIKVIGTDKLISWHQKATSEKPAGAYLTLFSRPDAIARANEITEVTFYYKNKKTKDIIKRTKYYPETDDYIYYSEDIEGYTPYKTLVKYRHLTSAEITSFFNKIYDY